MLLFHGADVHGKEASGMTPLHVAAFYGKKEVATLLVAKGAAIETKDKSGHTALYYSVANNHIDTSILLHRYESVKAYPALATLPPKPDLVDRYKWTSDLAKRAGGLYSEGITVIANSWRTENEVCYQETAQ